MTNEAHVVLLPVRLDAAVDAHKWLNYVANAVRKGADLCYMQDPTGSDFYALEILYNGLELAEKLRRRPRRVRDDRSPNPKPAC